MADVNKLAEQHIREHEVRLTRLDELLGQAEEKKAESTEDSQISEDLAVLRRERDKLASHVDELKLRSKENWQEEQIGKTGPMGIWDAVAQQLEKLVERMERK
ncbi:MAG: hypothetical protein MI754_04265 [Chromatiales bacterium]|nr:hypothetical protein [Chromatiales bacterium]